MPRPKILLFNTLENLSKYDFNKFKMYLNTELSDRWKPIAKSRLESALLTDIVDTMVSHYGEESAVSLAVEILKQINNNEAAEQLEGASRGGEKPAASTSSSTAVSPATGAAAPAPAAAPAAISAQGGAVVFAPTVMGGTTGSWNVTINK